MAIIYTYFGFLQNAKPACAHSIFSFDRTRSDIFCGLSLATEHVRLLCSILAFRKYSLPDLTLSLVGGFNALERLRDAGIESTYHKGIQSRISIG